MNAHVSKGQKRYKLTNTVCAILQSGSTKIMAINYDSSNQFSYVIVRCELMNNRIGDGVENIPYIYLRIRITSR